MDLYEAFTESASFHHQLKVLKKPQVTVNYDEADVLHRNKPSHCSLDQLPMTQGAYLICLKSTPSSSFTNITQSSSSAPAVRTGTHTRQTALTSLRLFPKVCALRGKPSHAYYSFKRIQMFHWTIRGEM